MKRIEHNEEKWVFPFVEYSPEETTKAPLPLIIQLHGAGERGSGGDELVLVDVHGFSKTVTSQNQSCIIVMPQCPKDTFWAARVESIISFIEALKNSFNVDENRIYLTGLSMGGYGTWYTAMARPDLFAAIAPVCGGGMAWNSDVLNMPVWAFHGVCDPTVSVTQSDEMVAALEAHGKNVRYSRLVGVGHNAWDYAYNGELLSWLLTQKKK